MGKLAVWHHAGSAPIKGRVILIHGICEHSGRHLNTVNFLNSHNFDVVRFDLRGAGHSGGPRQYIDHFNDYIDDTMAVFNWIQSNLDPTPLFLMGHSMGGAIAIHVAPKIQSLLKGLVLSAPAYIAGSAVPPLKVLIGRAINQVIPKFRIRGDSDKTCLSRIQRVNEEYYQDPYSFHFNTVRQGSEVLNAMAEIPKIVPKITIPTWMVHGTHDRLILLKGSFEILMTLGSKDKTLWINLGGFHEPHNDLGQVDYFRNLQYWLEAHAAEIVQSDILHFENRPKKRLEHPLR